MANPVLVGVNDLFFSSKIQAAAGQLGVALQCLPSCDRVLEAGREAAPPLVILDLDSVGGDPIELIRSLKAEDRTKATRIAGFCRHTNPQMIAAADRAGIDRVLPRSDFFPALPDLLRSCASGTGTAEGVSG